jgi:hypothetical protein
MPYPFSTYIDSTFTPEAILGAGAARRDFYGPDAQQQSRQNMSPMDALSHAQAAAQMQQDPARQPQRRPPAQTPLDDWMPPAPSPEQQQALLAAGPAMAGGIGAMGAAAAAPAVAQQTPTHTLQLQDGLASGAAGFNGWGQSVGSSPMNPGLPPGARIGQLTGSEFQQMMNAGALNNPSSINLADLNRWLTVGSGVVGLGGPEAAQQRQQALNAFLQLQHGSLGQQAESRQLGLGMGDLGLRQTELLGLPPGAQQGVGGRLSNDAARVDIERGRYAYETARENLNNAAVRQYLISNPNATQQQVAAFRRNLERSTPTGAPAPTGAQTPLQAGGMPPGAGATRPPTPTQPTVNETPMGPRTQQQQQPEVAQDRFDEAYRSALTTVGAPTGGPTEGTIPSNKINEAITEFVHNLGTQFVAQHIRELHPYMIQRFGAQNMDNWFGVRDYTDSTASRARDIVTQALQGAGARVERSQLNPQTSTWIRMLPGFHQLRQNVSDTLNQPRDYYR